MALLVRDGVSLAFDDVGRGDQTLVFVHGIACHRGFWATQVRYFAGSHRVVAVDLRGHGESSAPHQRYTMRGFADDVMWLCGQLQVVRPVVIGHSLGGLVALELAAAYPDWPRAAVLIDSVLLPDGHRVADVDQLVGDLRGPGAEPALRHYFAGFFGPYDQPRNRAWILEEAVRTPPYVTSSVWEESMTSWDEVGALKRCQVPLLYLDAGTQNADLEHARQLQPSMIVGKTVGSGHFSPLEVPDQVNAMIDRFLTIAVQSQ
jgi:pimeloyl-ACP methyl ester carboxylesterase